MLRFGGMLFVGHLLVCEFRFAFLDTSCIFRDDVNHVEAVHGAIHRPSAGQFHCLADDLHPLSFVSCQSGIRIGLFSSDVELLNQACSLHGLVLGRSHSVVKLRNLLLQHFLHGECLASDTRSKHHDYTACDMLMSVDTSAISGDNLWTVTQSI
ncbi:hypothetical protein EV424DRAFT_1368947 [Suillus variegatus]|nr:hypothetical protein EV424DRAFT_1368947 [Suillus variegatus]